MKLEPYIASLHHRFFFREFSFSRNQFRLNSRTEVEFADLIVYVEPVLLIYQLKERQIAEPVNVAAERNWFEKKVLKNGSSQIRDTLAYLDLNQTVALPNDRGQVVEVNSLTRADIHRIIVFRNPHLAAGNLSGSKLSREGGFIHVFSDADYGRVLNEMKTPAETAEYLSYRAQVLPFDPTCGESALLEGFLSKYSQNDQAVLRQTGDLTRRIAALFVDRITNTVTNEQYRQILSELANLRRIPMLCFEHRFSLCYQAAVEAVDPVITEFMTERCAFLFFVLPKSFSQEQHLQITSNLAEGLHYARRRERAVVVSFRSVDSQIDISWGLVNDSWKFESEWEELLQIRNPFSDLHQIPQAEIWTDDGHLRLL